MSHARALASLDHVSTSWLTEAGALYLERVRAILDELGEGDATLAEAVATPQERHGASVGAGRDGFHRQFARFSKCEQCRR